MRIVAVADTHLFHSEIIVPDGDVFVHAGDLCRGGELEELAEAAAGIKALPHQHKIVVAGNHDWSFVHEPARAREVLGTDVVYLQDNGCVVDGVTFWGSPWQPEYNEWAFNLPRGAALAERWALIPHGVDVLITHGPPAGNGDGVGIESAKGVRKGCVDLAQRVRIVRPRLHLFGHIHQDGGVSVDDGITFVNCTTWECERAPTVVDVDAGGVHPVVVPARSTH